MFLECPRKWAFRFIDRVVVDEALSPWRGQGDRMHAHLERWRNDPSAFVDMTDPEQRVASAAMGYWPEGPWLPEQWVYVERDGHAFHGKSDQFDPAGFVGDYKFVGNKLRIPGAEPNMPDEVIARRAAWLLQRHPQWIIYAGATRGPVCEGQWTYVIKPPRMQGEARVIPVRWREPRAEIDRKLAALDHAARAMIRFRDHYERANDVPHNADGACMGLGVQCDFGDRHCRLTYPGKEMPV